MSEWSVSVSSLEPHRSINKCLRVRESSLDLMREGPQALERGWFWEISTLEKLGNYYFFQLNGNRFQICLDLVSSLIG